MSMRALGVKPEPETVRVVVGGPAVVERDTAGSARAGSLDSSEAANSTQAVAVTAGKSRWMFMGFPAAFQLLPPAAPDDAFEPRTPPVPAPGAVKMANRVATARAFTGRPIGRLRSRGVM